MPKPKRSKKPKTKETVSLNGGEPRDLGTPEGRAAMEQDVAKVIDEGAIARKAKKVGGKEAAAKAIELLESLRELGHPLMWPTKYRPHLCARKKTKKEQLLPIHGVAFKRDGDHCMVHASNNRALVRIRLPHQGVYAPSQAIVPVKAMRMLAAATDEEACLWFSGTKVSILVDDELHQYRCIDPELPFPSPELDRKATGTVSRVTVNATYLEQIQEALAATCLEVRFPNEHMISLIPEGDEKSDGWGFCALIGEA